MKALMMATAALALTGGAAAQMARPTVAPAPAPSAAIARALADPARADQAGDDARRQAAAVIAFAGLRPGQTVIDFLPGRGYWTRIFTGVVGPTGHVYALWPSTAAKPAAAGVPALQALHLANVTAELQPTPLLTVPKPVDLVWTVQNYHDLANRGAGEPGLRAFAGSAFTALKPGGTFVVIDHADAPGSELTGTDTRHRIDPAAVKRIVTAAGFRFAGESTVLRNPADDHTANVFDPAIRGHTDQFVYKFRKPR